MVMIKMNNNSLSKNNILECNHLTKIFDTGSLFRKSFLTAVEDVSFDISSLKPSITAIVGESGSGKTTLCNMILGLLDPTSGEIIYKGTNIMNMSSKERINYNRDVQAIFQDPYEIYNPFYKALRIIETTIRKYKLSSSPEEENELILKSLKTVGLSQEDVFDKHPHQLSGGQRQRLAIARAFLSNPKIIIADEPVSMIDTSIKGGILQTIHSLKESYNVSFLYITHDLSTAYTISDKAIVLYRGSIIEGGKMDKIVKDPYHPYLQLLIDSVPTPDPNERWTESMIFKVETFDERSAIYPGCKYYTRCPKAMEICAKERPKRLIISKDHFVFCHLY